jgi:hypothetical protein
MAVTSGHNGYAAIDSNAARHDVAHGAQGYNIVKPAGPGISHYLQLAALPPD